MTIQEVFEAIELIASKSSKNEKLEILASAMKDADFKRVVIATYDRTKVYGIAKKSMREIKELIPTLARSPEATWTDATWKMLDDLASGALSGNAAISLIAHQMSAMDHASAILLERVILKDMRAGFTEDSILKVDPKALKDYPYMRCSLPAKSNMEKWDWSKGVVSQEKADGMFVNVNLTDAGFVHITTRQGSPVPLDEIGVLVDEIRETLRRGTQSHGEMLVVEDGAIMPREKGNGVLNSLLSGGSLDINQSIVLQLWDQIPLSAVQTKGKHEERYIDRIHALQTQLVYASKRISVVDTRVVFSKEAALDHYRQKLREGKEGTVIKSADAIWKDGTSKDQVKFKLEVPVELKVVGFEEGTGKYEGQLGAFVMESECGELRVNVSGRGDAQRKEVWENQADWLNRICTVLSNSVMAPADEAGKHSLFLPRFIEVRSDKSTADTLLSIKEQFASAVA